MTLEANAGKSLNLHFGVGFFQSIAESAGLHGCIDSLHVENQECRSIWRFGVMDGRKPLTRRTHQTLGTKRQGTSCM